MIKKGFPCLKVNQSFNQELGFIFVAIIDFLFLMPHQYFGHKIKLSRNSPNSCVLEAFECHGILVERDIKKKGFT
jgi:hypothetical protein